MMAQNLKNVTYLDAESGHHTMPPFKQKSHASPPHLDDHDPGSRRGKLNYSAKSHSASCPDNLHKFHGHHHHLSNGNELWVDGLLCAYEFISAVKHKVEVGGKFGQKSGPVHGNFTAEIIVRDPQVARDLPALEEINGGSDAASNRDLKAEKESEDGSIGRSGSKGLKDEGKEFPRNQWVPIGWARISELVQYVQSNTLLSECMMDEGGSDDDSLAVADQAAPYWQLPVGPIWWCHVHAGHPHISSWLAHAQWLHPAISSALRDESRLISERMKHLFYEVPVRVAGGLLFELLGQSVGDPHHNEEDVPIVLRSWTSLNFLITAVHVKGETPNGLNVIGVSEVQDIVGAGGASAPRTAHEVVAVLTDRLARWDDRLYRKHYFGEADEVELKFVSRRGNEDLAILGIILNQEIRRLSTQVIRVKWSLHAREEIVYELQAHLRGKNTKAILNRIAKNTRAMLEEQEAVRDRLFTVQDVMQSTVRASLQDASVRIQHNLAIIGGGGLFLSIVAGLFGINVDGIPGNENTPYAFGLFTAVFFLVGTLIVGLGMMYLGFRKPPTEEQLASRKLELQTLVKKFQNSAETHEKVRDVDHSSHGRDGQPAIVLGPDDFTSPWTSAYPTSPMTSAYPTSQK